MPIQDSLFDDMPVDFRDMLAKPIGEWESKPLLPPCHLYGECIDVITGLSKNKGTRYFGFVCQANEVVPQQTKAAEIVKLLNGVSITDYEFPRRENLGTGLPSGQIWLSPNAMPMNRDFFTSMGFSEAKPMDECIVEMRGKKVLMEIGRDSYENNQGQTREFNVMVSLTQDPR